jgi:hypothetical protein
VIVWDPVAEIVGFRIAAVPAVPVTFDLIVGQTGVIDDERDGRGAGRGLRLRRRPPRVSHTGNNGADHNGSACHTNYQP